MRRPFIAAAFLASLGGCNRNQAANPAQNKVAGVPDAAVPDANPAATVPTRSNEASTDDYVAKAAVIELFAIQTAPAIQEQLDRAQALRG